MRLVRSLTRIELSDEEATVLAGREGDGEDIWGLGPNGYVGRVHEVFDEFGKSLGALIFVRSSLGTKGVLEKAREKAKA